MSIFNENEQNYDVLCPGTRIIMYPYSLFKREECDTCRVHYGWKWFLVNLQYTDAI